MTSRGTEYTVEERQLRPRDGKQGIERWIENVFFALGEVTFLSLPAFTALMDADPNAAVKYAALFVWATLTLAIGTLRGERFGAAWPSMSPLSFVVRLGYYNAVVLLVTRAGVRADLAFRSPVVTAGVAVVLSVGAAMALPRLVPAVTSRLAYAADSVLT
ncbi:hypothetical protein [Haladaptatus sp. NG-WS-4]